MSRRLAAADETHPHALVAKLGVSALIRRLNIRISAETSLAGRDQFSVENE